MKLFSTKVHGLLDYVSVGTMLALPRVLGWSPTVKSVVTGAALSTLVYSLLTRYELGIFKILPMRAHLTLDALSGAMFCAAPFLFPDEDTNVTGTLVGLGMFELMAAFTSETEPSIGEQASQIGDQIRSSVQQLRDKIYDVPATLQQ